MHHPRVSLFVTILVGIAAGCAAETTVPEELTLVSEATSYQIRFDEGAVDWGDFPPYDGSSTSLVGAEARLDLSLDGDDVVAHVTQRFGTPAELRGAFDETDLILIPVETWGVNVGLVRIESMTLRGEIVEGVPRITSEIAIEGREMRVLGDVAFEGDVSATGTIRVDDVAPEVRVSRSTAFYELTPWEAISVTLSEPLDEDAFLSQLDVSAPFEVELREAFGLVHGATITPVGWWPDADVSVDVPGLVDLVGNEGTSEPSAFARFDEVTPQTMFDFESPETSLVTAWNVDDTLEVDCASGSDCLRMHRAEYESVGLYTRIDGDVSVVAFSIRARQVDPDFYGWLNLRVHVEIGEADGGPVTSFDHYLEASVDYEDPESIADTGWIDLEIPVPTSFHTPGVAISVSDANYGAGYGGCGDYGCGGAGAPIALASPTDVFIDDLHGR